MSLLSTFSQGAARAAEIPGDSTAAFLKTLADGAGLTAADDGQSGWLGLVMSGLAGIAAALAVAILLTLYFRSRYRSARDVLKHGLMTLTALGLLAFAGHDMRHAALAYLGVNPSRPSVEFEIRLPKAAAAGFADAQVELRTDRNQTLAHLWGAQASDDDSRSILRGSVALDFRTSDRVMILSVQGEAQRRFKLRLAANPSHSDQFGPWHLADDVVSPTGEPEARPQLNDAFAIRYRVM